MDDLVRWLGEQLDEDERIARAVRVPPDWHQGPGDDPEWTDEEMVCMWPPEFHTPYEKDKHWRGLTVEGPELAAHIAEHDPARVLREIEADRKLLAEFVAVGAREVGLDDAFEYADGWVNALGQAVRLRASVFSDRPGYREEWRP